MVNSSFLWASPSLFFFFFERGEGLSRGKKWRGGGGGGEKHVINVIKVFLWQNTPKKSHINTKSYIHTVFLHLQ